MKWLAVLLPILLAACGTLPEPFYGDPGVEGAKLAVPPAPVMIVPAPTQAMLDDKSAVLYANDLAAALVALDIPSIARPAGKKDWRLTTTASINGTTVTPAYAITGPDGKPYGTQTGSPVAADAWANGDAAALNAAASRDALLLSQKLATVNAEIQQSNPNSLENRPPHVFMGAVTGAPGDGDSALATDMSRDLPSPYTEVVTNPADADFMITGHIKTQPDTNHQLLVELDWTVTDTSKRQIGQVTQLHDLMPSDIEPYWGDVAAAAATEAAGGVNDVITKAVLHHAPKP